MLRLLKVNQFSSLSNVSSVGAVEKEFCVLVPRKTLKNIYINTLVGSPRLDMVPWY